MSTYPVSKYAQGSIFNPSRWISGEDGEITEDFLNANYLKYPVAQGFESLNGVSVFGSASFQTLPTSTGSLPLYNDSSTKIPTTQWVQSAISGGGIITTIEYPRASFLISDLPNTSPLPVFPTIRFSNYSGLEYYDGVQFMMSVNITTYASSLNATSSTTTITNLGLFTFMLTIYPKALVATPSGIFYLDNGVGSAGSNTGYAPISNPYAPYGRPFYVSTMINEGNIVNALPVSFTTNATTNSFQCSFPAINYAGSTATNSYTINLQLLNKGKMARDDISTYGFTTSEFPNK